MSGTLRYALIPVDGDAIAFEGSVGAGVVTASCPVASVSQDVIIVDQGAVTGLQTTVLDPKNDGKVSVANTKLDGMTDHIVLPATHTFMMNNPLVIAQTLHFLQHGRFDHELTLRELFRRVIRP